MKLDKIGIKSSIESPVLWFAVGLAVVMLALWFPFIPNWQTFIHMWRVEIAASVLLLFTVGYVAFTIGRERPDLKLYPDEWKFVVLPITAFILWSGLSAFWAPSWKSAAHHTFVWIEYLILYIVFRQLIERNANFKVLLSVFVFALLLYSLPAILEYGALLTFGGGTTIGIRFAKYGEQILTILPLVLIGVIRTRGKMFAIGVAVVAALWLLIFCSFGRANYFLFAAAVAAMFSVVAISKRYRRYAPRFAILIAVLIITPLPFLIYSSFYAPASATAFDRFANAEAISGSNNFRKLMVSLSAEMVRENPVAGIGADNFGMQVNEYRQRYGAANPADVNLANAEDQIPQHAHNEFLQVAAELGVIGFAIFAWLLAGIGVMAVRSLRTIRSGSLYPFAAMMGLGMFLASSLVSSYSFRVMQNGIVFFFVLAVAAGYLFKPERDAEQASRIRVSPLQLRFVCVAAIAACVGLIAYSGLRLSSVIVTGRANQTRSTADAMPLYELAIRLDDENPDVRHNLGMRLFRRQRYGEAVQYLEAAVRLGRAPSAELSYLATARSLSGDPGGAEATMKIASDLYPRSPFVLTRYSTLLEANGKPSDAAAIFERAKAINERASATWRTVILSGPKVLSELAARDKSYMHVMELKPEGSIYAVVTERYIRFPEERRFSLVKVVIDED